MTIFHYDLNAMIPATHPFRKFQEWLPMEGISQDWEELKKGLGREGYGYAVGIRALFLQFYGDHSDREMEEALRYNFLYRWFCGFDMEAVTPDHTYFGRMRKALGRERMAKLFAKLLSRARERKLLRGLDVFVDSSAITRKETTWEERDKAKEAGETDFNNRVVSQYSADPEAQWGCKGGGTKKYWYGYKRHVSVVLDEDLITGVAVTPANVNDDEGFEAVCPWGGRVYGDKAYDSWKVRGLLAQRGCEDRILRKRAKTEEEKRRNRELSRRRALGERVFSKVAKRTRYIGVAKTLMQVMWESIVHNVKRLTVLETLPVYQTA